MSGAGPLRVIVAGHDGSVTALAQAIGEDAEVERLDPAELPERLARAPLPEAIALLPDVTDPLELVQLAAGVDHDLGVLVLAADRSCEELAARMLFTPFVGPHTRCLEPGDPAEAAAALMDAARACRGRRRLHADLAAATERLAAPRAAVPATGVTPAPMAAVLDAAPVGVLDIDEEGRVRRWTAPAVELLGVRSRGQALAELVAPEARAELERYLRAARDGGREPFLVPVDGEARCVELTAAAYRAPGGSCGTVVFVVDATQRVRLEAARRRVEREQRFLAQAGAVLDASLDLDETLERIAGLAVPELGDLCVIDSLGSDGRFAAATVVAADADVAATVREARARWPVAPDSDHPAARVVRSGRSRLLRALTPEDLARYAQGPEHLAVLRRLGYRSGIVAPLVARGRRHGAISVVRLTDPAPYADADLALVEALATRAATALDNAWLYARERGIAATLQSALLPDRLPSLPGARIAARYRPAADGLDVGGDWYDALPVAGGRVGLVIGDVVGRGLRAAAVMGQLRNFLRAHAAGGEDPARVLEILVDLMARLGVGDFATVVYADVDVASGEARIASAGHPPPVLLRPDGRAELVDVPAQPPLVPGLEVARRSCAIRLEPGAALLLYTDGVVERRTESIDVGLARLLDASAGAGLDLDALCDRVLDASGAEGADDDRALIAVRLMP